MDNKLGRHLKEHKDHIVVARGDGFIQVICKDCGCDPTTEEIKANDFMACHEEAKE